MAREIILCYLSERASGERYLTFITNAGRYIGETTLGRKVRAG